MLRHLIQIWDIIISDLLKTQVIYVRLFYRGENIDTSAYQWELLTHQTFSNRKWMIHLIDLNLSVRTYMTFWS